MRHAILLLLAILLPCCSERDRGDIVDVRDYPSPDGRYVLTVFQKMFYDTTGYPRHVYLRRTGQKLRYPGNVYVTPVWGDVAVSWTSRTNVSLTLQLEVPPNLPPPTNVGGITITFSEPVRK